MLTIIYDTEEYPNCFTPAAEDADSPLRWCFEISEFRDDTNDLLEWIEWIKAEGGRMVGFNNVGFDYPCAAHAARDEARQPGDPV